jgi:hypothetical protein
MLWREYRERGLRTVAGDYALSPLAERMNTDAVTAQTEHDYE